MMQEVGETFELKNWSLNKFLSQLKLLPELKSFLKLIILSLGQASIEREYNVNKSVFKFNISQDPVVARKLIIDHMRKKDLIPSNIEMLSHLAKVKKAKCGIIYSKMRYNMCLNEQKKVQKKKDQNDQIAILNAKFEDVNSKKQLLINFCQCLENEFVELIK